MQTQKAWNIEYQNGKKSTFKTPSLDEMIKDWRDNTKEINVIPRGEDSGIEEETTPVVETPVTPVEPDTDEEGDTDNEI